MGTVTRKNDLKNRVEHHLEQFLANRTWLDTKVGLIWKWFPWKSKDYII